MNWFKENPVLAAIAAFALLGTAWTGFLALDALSRHEQAIVDYNLKITDIRRLQAMKPYPDPDNLKKVEEGINAYESEIHRFKEEMNKMEAPLVEITPEIFQDNLRKAVDDLRKLAAQKKVALPEKFFFGFENYQTQLPTLEETQKLNREFHVIRSLVESIIPLGITSLDTLTRIPGSPTKPKGEDPKASPPKAIPFDSFTLGITAPQSCFIAAFDKIPDAPGFLIVRSMIIENSNPTPPPKAASPGRPAAQPKAASLGIKDAEADKLPVVFGTELVKGSILFEIPDFPDKATPPANQPPPAK